MKSMPLWFYTASFVIIITSILTLGSVLPIDVIVQSKTNNTHLATNSVIIWVICVVFVFYSAVFHMFRLIHDRMQLQDIPIPYIPVTDNDIGKSMSKNIQLELLRSNKIKELSKPNTVIRHPGLFHRTKIDYTYNNIDDNELPDNLIYENIIKIIGQELKYNGTLTINNNNIIKLDNHYSLRELFSTYEKNDQNFKTFLDLYDKLRFSGEPITCNEFKNFLKLWNYVKSKL